MIENYGKSMPRSLVALLSESIRARPPGRAPLQKLISPHRLKRLPLKSPHVSGKSHGRFK